jgi:glucosamine--fructose-6-phosphate aminotransferase (isomerizing)
MCGIVGYIGPQQAAPILMEGLSKLEYRGYDSAGIAVHDGMKMHIHRAPGKLAVLARLLEKKPLSGHLGIGHTRWATHGPPSEQNAHPHASGKAVVVHNGILENHQELRLKLEKKGRHFSSQTDTEVFAHLIDEELDRYPLLEAVRRSLKVVRGTYALVVISTSEPDKIVVARSASPLVIGLGKGENLVASDIPAILNHTRQFVFLDVGELAEITAEAVKIQTLDGKTVQRSPRQVDWTPLMAEKGGYKHFMLKEIHEQPRALADTLTGRIPSNHQDAKLDSLTFSAADWKSFRRIMLVACGTSYHAGLVGKFLIERLARIPVEVDLASEFRYRGPILSKDDLVVAISQSGETADTLAAIVEARRLKATVMSICNVLEASIPRASDQVLYTHAGPEIGVASTKAFVTQIAALFLLAVRFGRARGKLSASEAQAQLDALSMVPDLLQQVLREENLILEVAKTYAHAHDFLYIARGINYPIALEGALKLKEISYIHAEGYAAGEMKHGPIALIDEHMPVVAIATKNDSYEKILSNLAEVQARGGQVIAVCSHGDKNLDKLCRVQIPMPDMAPTIEPMVNVLPLQLLAYHIADFNGTDVDQPRNLAKSVTVE